MHVSDWNYEDRYYQLTLDQLKGFKEEFVKNGLRMAWDWLTSRIKYDKKDANPLRTIKTGTVNMNLSEVFLDYMEPDDSIAEWEF